MPPKFKRTKSFKRITPAASAAPVVAAPTVTPPPVGRESNRPDTQMYGFDEPYMEKVRQGMVNTIAMNDYIPERMKPGMAALSQGIMEIPRAAIEFFSSPETVVTPGLLRPRGTVAPKIPPPVTAPIATVTKPRQLALPAAGETHNPYIAGSGGVQKSSLLHPQEEARLQGINFVQDANGTYIPEGKPTNATGGFTDLNEVKEAERQKNLFFTKHEQTGGTALEVPDRPYIDAPPVAGETKLGFARASNADLPYPLNVAPEATRPRSAQEVTRALAGPDMAAPVGKTTKPQFANEPAPLPRQQIEVVDPTQAIRPGEPILPSAPVKPSRFKRVTSKKESAPNSIAADKGLDNDTVTAAANSSNPVVKQTVYDYAKERATVPWLSFASTRLKSMGDSGVELFRRGSRAIHKERFNVEDWITKLEGHGKKLSKDELANFGQYAEGKLPIPNDKVKTAVDEWKRVEQLAGTSAEKSGMVIEDALGNKRPFAKIDSGYWPRRLKDTDLPKLESKIDELVDEGLSRRDAERIMKNARKHGELVLSEQHERLNKRFDYRQDFESGLIHLRKMAKKVAQTEELGRKDIAGRGGEGIADLIEQTSDPKAAYDIMNRIVMRDVEINKSLDKFVRHARTTVSALRLQNYGLSSIVGNQLPNMLVSNAKEYTKSLGAFVGKNKAIRDKAAALVDMGHGLFEYTNKVNPMKWYGGNIAEGIVRGQAAGIGHGMAKTYFREAKAGNKAAMKELFELTLEDSNKVIKQKELTPDQLRFAAARMAEKAQGLTNPFNMPMFMSRPVTGEGDALLQLALIFKKQATIQSKLLKDSFKKNPVKTTALIAGFSQLAGGAIGTAKSAAIGTTRAVIGNKDVGESIQSELEHRADYLGQYGIESKEAREAIDRALQSWAFGIASDVVFWGLDSGKFLEGIAGPVAGLAADVVGNIGNPKQLGREALRALPIPGPVGQAAQKELLPTKAQENAEKSSRVGSAKNRSSAKLFRRTR